MNVLLLYKPHNTIYVVVAAILALQGIFQITSVVIILGLGIQPSFGNLHIIISAGAHIKGRYTCSSLFEKRFISTLHKQSNVFLNRNLIKRGACIKSNGWSCEICCNIGVIDPLKLHGRRYSVFIMFLRGPGPGYPSPANSFRDQQFLFSIPD